MTKSDNIRVAWHALRGHPVAYKLRVIDGALVLNSDEGAFPFICDCCFARTPKEISLFSRFIRWLKRKNAIWQNPRAR